MFNSRHNSRKQAALIETPQGKINRFIFGHPNSNINGLFAVSKPNTLIIILFSHTNKRCSMIHADAFTSTKLIQREIRWVGNDCTKYACFDLRYGCIVGNRTTTIFEEIIPSEGQKHFKIINTNHEIRDEHEIPLLANWIVVDKKGTPFDVTREKQNQYIIRKHPKDEELKFFYSLYSILLLEERKSGPMQPDILFDGKSWLNPSRYNTEIHPKLIDLIKTLKIPLNGSIENICLIIENYFEETLFPKYFKDNDTNSLNQEMLQASRLLQLISWGMNAKQLFYFNIKDILGYYNRIFHYNRGKKIIQQILEFKINIGNENFKLDIECAKLCSILTEQLENNIFFPKFLSDFLSEISTELNRFKKCNSFKIPSLSKNIFSLNKNHNHLTRTSFNRQVFARLLDELSAIDLKNKNSISSFLSYPINKQFIKESYRHLNNKNFAYPKYTPLEELSITIQANWFPNIINEPFYNELDRLLIWLSKNNLIFNGRRTWVNSKLNFGKTLAHLAAERNCSTCLEILIRRNININAITEKHEEYYEEPATVTAARYGALESLKVLLFFKANPNSHDGLNRTALLFACQNGSDSHHKCAELLLKCEADPNIRPKILPSPMHQVVMLMSSFLPPGVFSGLEKINQDLGWAPIHYAVNRKDEYLYRLLFKYGAEYKPLKENYDVILKADQYKGPCIELLPSANTGVFKKYLAEVRTGDDYDTNIDDNSHTDNNLVSRKQTSLHEEIKRQKNAEKRFFRFQRSQLFETARLKKEFSKNRTQRSNYNDEVNITEISTRSIIMADTGSLKEVIQASGGKHALTSSYNFNRNLQFHQQGMYKNQPNYNFQNIRLSGNRITYSHKPVIGHLGGFYMLPWDRNNKATYNDVINLIASLTRNNPAYERFLAAEMIKYAQTGNITSKQEFRKKGINISDLQYRGFSHICFLTSVKEITRRIKTGLRRSGSKVPKLPFAIMHSRALELVKAGHLKMREVFGQNSPYGLATGTSITSAYIQRSYEKIKRINRMYNEFILLRSCSEAKKLVKHNPYSLLTPKTERLHKELLNTYGGEEESTGDNYSSEEEENNDDDDGNNFEY